MQMRRRQVSMLLVLLIGWLPVQPLMAYVATNADTCFDTSTDVVVMIHRQQHGEQIAVSAIPAQPPEGSKHASSPGSGCNEKGCCSTLAAVPIILPLLAPPVLPALALALAPAPAPTTIVVSIGTVPPSS